MNDKLCLHQKHSELRLRIFDPVSRKVISYNSGPKAHNKKDRADNQQSRSASAFSSAGPQRRRYGR